MKKYYLIDHKILFLFGFMFYLLTPYIVGVSNIFKGFPGMVLYQMISKQKISYFLIIGTTLTAFLLLSMGGRMYVFQTLVIVLVYKTSFAPKRWKPYQILAVAIAGFFIGSVSGIWRMGAHYNI